jgi:hypothetical protein
MSRRSKSARAAVLASALMVGAAFVLTPWSAGRASEASSTTERKQAEKQQKKKDKEFNRDIEYRRMIGPKVLALGPYSISLFVRGQPLEARLRVAVQMTTEQARVQLEAQKMAVNGIVYPLAVRLFEQGRPTTDQIRAFKDDTRTQLLQRYPDMIDEVFIESMI